MTGETILVVEDEGLIALHLSEMLEKAGYRVISPALLRRDGIRALETSPKPDLVLMDIGLAGSLDGIETSRQIRQRHNIPIIFLTAYSNETKIAEAKSISPYGYISKPCLKKISWMQLRVPYTGNYLSL